MRLRLDVRDLVLASWRVERESVARTLPPGLEPVDVDGEQLASLVAFRCVGGRLGRLPVPPFSQLNVRTYVRFRGEPAVFFLRAHVTWAGMGGALFGAPYRPTRLGVGPGRVRARGIGVDVRYATEGPGEPAALARHELGLFEAAGVRSFRIRRGAADWFRARPVERPRADVLLALGFDVREPASLFSAPHASFETDVPPRRIG